MLFVQTNQPGRIAFRPAGFFPHLDVQSARLIIVEVKLFTSGELEADNIDNRYCACFLQHSLKQRYDDVAETITAN